MITCLVPLPQYRPNLDVAIGDILYDELILFAKKFTLLQSMSWRIAHEKFPIIVFAGNPASGS